MNSVNSKDPATTNLTRRDFVATAIATVGGLALFNIPNKAYAQSEVAVFDSLGTKIDTAKQISKVIPMDIHAQTLLETLYPEALASLAKEVSVDASDFQEAGMAQVAALPETGTSQGTFGKKADAVQIRQLNPDLVLHVVFDSSNEKIASEKVQYGADTQTIYLDISFGKLQDAYRTLGKILGCRERAEELTKYIDEAQMKARHFAELGLEYGRVFYGPRVDGKKVGNGVCVQLSAMRSLGINPITDPYDFDKHTVDFDILKSEDPEFVILDDTEFLKKYYSGQGEVFSLWSNIPAIMHGRYAVAPALMHNILGSPVFAQSIGMFWVAFIASSQMDIMNLADEIYSFYELFYGLTREKDQIIALIG